MFGNNKGTNLQEVLFIIAMFAFLLLPFLIAKLWWWVGFVVGVIIYFAIIEITTKVKTGRTLSQRFWKYSETHRVGAWVCLASLAIGWGMLLLHLAWKMLK